VSIYGYIEVTSIMEILKENPSIDTYANNYEFQIVAFVFTKGVISLVILLAILGIEATYFSKKLKKISNEPK
jgi:uncharacterized membrane protein